MWPAGRQCTLAARHESLAEAWTPPSPSARCTPPSPSPHPSGLRQVFTRDMAERLLEEGLNSLEKRLQLQITAGRGNGATTGGAAELHPRKGFALDGEPAAAAAEPPQAAPAAAAAAVAAVTARPPEPLLPYEGPGGLAGVSMGAGRRRGKPLKPLLEVEGEGEDASVKKGAGAAEEGGTGGASSLSTLQQRVQQAYHSQPDAE